MLLLFEGMDAVRETLRFFEEKSRSGLWSLDLKTRKLDWSRNHYALLGLEPFSIEPSMELIRKLTHPDDVRLVADMEAVLCSAGSYERQFRIVHANRRVRWLRLKGDVLLNTEGTAERAVGIIIDFTEEQEAIAQIRTQLHRTQTLVARVAVGTWIASPDGHFIDSSRYDQLTGRAPSEGLGMDWLNDVHPDDRDRVRHAWRHAVTRIHPFKCEFRMRFRDGVHIWVRSHGVPQTGEDGKVREWVGISLNIQADREWTGATDRITGAQLRAARALINWSVRDLAEHSSVSQATIRRLEEFDRMAGDRAVPVLTAALEKYGVEFLFPPDGNPAVRLRQIGRIH
jgi:PAS domain S-box-containing protein